MRRWFLPNLSKQRQGLVHMTVNSCPLRWDCSQWSKHKLTIDSFWQMVWEELGLQFGPERAETAGPSPPANALKRAAQPQLLSPKTRTGRCVTPTYRWGERGGWLPTSLSRRTVNSSCVMLTSAVLSFYWQFPAVTAQCVSHVSVKTSQ